MIVSKTTTLTGATQVSAGSAHTCALIGTDVQCWGRGLSGELGPLGAPMVVSTPVPVMLGTSVKQIALGSRHSCAALLNGGVLCWGQGNTGQLGDGKAIGSSTPVAAVGLESGSIVSLAAGGNVTCAVIDGSPRELYCWGDNGSEQLAGSAATSQSDIPVLIASIDNPTQVAVGSLHVCAVEADGTIKCWGQNDNGQLGTGTFSPQPVAIPTAVVGLPAGYRALDLELGYLQTCALVEAGSTRGVYCWGANSFGQLAHPPNLTPNPTPLLVPGLGPAPVTDIATISSATVCIRNTLNELYCWGENYYKQTGTGLTANTVEVPTKVIALP